MDESTPILTVAPELLDDVFTKASSDAERTTLEKSSSKTGLVQAALLCRILMPGESRNDRRSESE
jgi:hypothetical protein